MENGHLAGESSSPAFWVYVSCGLIAAALMLYAQTRAFTDDEGFHLLAAQLIKGGMRPYLDFCFPQTPLNAYWNALWMAIFGDSWRTAHMLSALETSAAVTLAAQFIYTRLPERPWRAAGAIAAAILIGLNANLFEFGALGQAYGICLFTSVIAFRLTIEAANRRSVWVASAAGAFAGDRGSGFSAFRHGGASADHLVGSAKSDRRPVAQSCRLCYGQRHPVFAGAEAVLQSAGGRLV